MKVGDLNQRHPDVDVEDLQDLRALYKGGKAFRDRLAKFLPQNGAEPYGLYSQRLAQAHYRNYFAGIVNYFAAKLMSASLVIRSVGDDGTSVEHDAFYDRLKEDCDGKGTDFDAFLREAVGDALVTRRSYWLVEKPDDGGPAAESRAEWEARGLGDVRLRRVDTCEVLDWECDDNGALLWAIVHDEKRPRRAVNSGRGFVEHRWTVYTRETVETWLYIHQAGVGMNADDFATLEVPTKPHGFSRVPLVCLDMGDGLWMGEHVRSPQLEHFRQSNAHAWMLRRTCYPMPVFKSSEEGKGLPSMGAGYAVVIGTEESFEWVGPDGGPFDAIASSVSSQKDEIFRVVHQMSLGVENNAAAIGRSAGSKAADAAVTSVILSSIGSKVRDAIEETFELASEGRGEAGKHRWSAEGLDSFDDVKPEELSAVLLDVQTIGIPSPTFQREVKARMALSVLPGISQETKDAIRDEIAKGVPDEAEEFMPLSPKAQADALAKSKQPPEEDGEDEEPEEDADE